MDSKVKRPTQAEAEEAVRTLIRWIGDDPQRGSLVDTPKRVVQSYKECFVGYEQNPEEILDKTFTDVGKYNDIILLQDIGFTSYCEHHLLPFKGKADIAYIPAGEVVGISKLARIIDCYAKRLQIQERLTTQVASAVYSRINAKGVAVSMTAEHECMACRGANKQGVKMKTYCMLGVYLEDQNLRNNFLNLPAARS